MGQTLGFAQEKQVSYFTVIVSCLLIASFILNVLLFSVVSGNLEKEAVLLKTVEEQNHCLLISEDKQQIIECFTRIKNENK